MDLGIGGVDVFIRFTLKLENSRCYIWQTTVLTLMQTVVNNIMKLNCLPLKHNVIDRLGYITNLQAFQVYF